MAVIKLPRLVPFRDRYLAGLLVVVLVLIQGHAVGQQTAGYITAAQGSSNDVCMLTDPSLQIYTDDGTMANGKTVTNSSGVPYDGGWNWYGFKTSNTGAVSHYVQVTGGGTVQNYTVCSGGGGGGGGGGSNPAAPAPGSWVRIKPAVIMDMSRFDVRGEGGNGWKFFFDDSVGTRALPFRNPDNFYLKGINGNGINYRGNRGLRAFVDLVGDTNILDMNLKYVLNDTTFFWDNVSGGGGCAIYMASLDSVLKYVPIAERPWYFARPDSLLRPFAVMAPNNGQSSGGVWRKTAHRRADTCRYVMIWAVKDTTGGNNAVYPDIGEIAFYGTPVHSPAQVKPWVNYTIANKPRRNFGKFFGLNIGTGYWSKYLKWRYGNRYYAWSNNKFDPGTNPTESVVFDANGYNDFNIYTHTFDTLNNQLDVEPWFASQGGNQLFLNESGLSDPNKVPHMDYNLEPEVPTSFKRSGLLAKNMAAKFGDNNLSLTTGQLNWNNDNPTGLGLNWFKGWENGNEEALRSGLTLLGYWSKSQSDYDGWEGRITGAGMRLASTNFKLYISATYLLDSNQTKTFVYFNHFFRTDSAYVWHDKSDHHYSSTINNIITYNPPAEDQVGQKGELASLEGYRYKVAATISTDNKYLRTYKKKRITEFGYDNYAQPMPAANQAGFHTIYGTPIYAGFDSLQSKALAIEDANMELFMSGTDQVIEFISENPCLCPNTNPATFGTAGEAQSAGFDMRPELTYAVHHFKNWMAPMLNNYDTAEVGTIVGSGDYRLYKLRHNIYTDSVVYYLKSTRLDGTTTNVNISVGSVTGNGTKKYLNFTDTPPTESAAVVSGGVISAVAQPRGQYFFLQETASGAPVIIQDVNYRNLRRTQ